MNGIHDLGGREGFGSVLGGQSPPSVAEEAKFKHPWERTAFGLVEFLIGSGTFNVDRFRHAVERVDPITYLSAGYYGRWFAAVEILLRDAGVLPASDAPPLAAPSEEQLLRVERAITELQESKQRPQASAQRKVDRAPRFTLGSKVRCRDLQRNGHCRLPSYARRRRGTVVEVHPAFVYPDTNSEDAGEAPQFVYSVQFRSEELWGDAGEPGVLVSVDLFECYLEDGGPDPADAVRTTISLNNANIQREAHP